MTKIIAHPSCRDEHRSTSQSTSILAIPGSLRRDSYNRRLLEAAAEVAPGHVDVTLYDGLEDIPVFNDDLVRGRTITVPEVVQLREAVAAADGILIATPEYNQSFSGVIKNVVDWLSIAAPERVLRRRPVAVTGATTGPWGTRLAQTALRQVLMATGAYVLPDPMLFVREAAKVFDEDGRLVDEATASALNELVTSLDQWIRSLAFLRAA